jgi:hypothetical protein
LTETASVVTQNGRTVAVDEFARNLIAGDSYYAAGTVMRKLAPLAVESSEISPP